jgi:hypothetical protein
VVEFPAVEPHAHDPIAKTFGELFAPSFILAGVAEKKIVLVFLFLIWHFGVSVIGEPLNCLRASDCGR